MHIKKNEEMWNEVFHAHRQYSPNCSGFLKWDQNAERPWGLVWQEQAICDKCSYRSSYYKLYEEVATNRPGRRAARPNVGVHVGLSQTPISTSSFQKILLALNTPAPSTSGMQKSANKVCPKLETINKADMKRLRSEIKKKKNKQSQEVCAIDIQSDGMYNNPLYSGVGKTPFQPATNCVYTVVENETDQKKVIALATKNKLCSKGHHLKKRDLDGQGVGCSGTDHQCTANIPFEKSIGDEYSWSKECLLQLKEDNLEVKHVTTDPDSSAHRAAEDLYNEGTTETEPESLLDTRHMSENHRKYIKNHIGLTDLMPGTTKANRTKLQNRFAIDLAERCQTEFNCAHTQLAGDYEKIKSALSYTSDAMILCYHGEHASCKKHSYVCKGAKKNWIQKSSYLAPDFKVKQTSDSASVLLDCINWRFNPATLYRTRHNSNTQKAEAVNRCLRRSLPKNVTFSRNFPGRAHSAIHSVNHGTAESITTLCNEIGAPVTKGSRVESQLKARTVKESEIKAYQKSEKFKQARKRRRTEVYQLYEKHQEQIIYQKNVVLPQMTPGTSKTDHSYSKVKKTRSVSRRK